MKSKLAKYEEYILDRPPLTCIGAWGSENSYWSTVFNTFGERGGCINGCNRRCPMYDQDTIKGVIDELSIS